MSKRYNYPLLSAVVILACAVSACSVVYKGTGVAVTGYAQDQGVPYMLATRDVSLGCSMAESFTPFLLSFSRVTAPPEKLAILLYLMAGNCSEFRAWEEELRFLRAVYDKRSIEAKDARIAQQRLLGQAARRQLSGYTHFVNAFGEVDNGCPEFDSDEEAFYWLVGLLNGIQAIMNDIAAGGSEGVPLNIAAKVGRGSACLDDDRWWGVPAAIKAAIEIVFGDQGADDNALLQNLENAVTTGLKQGMQVSQVLAAQVYWGQGKIGKVKGLIRTEVPVSERTQRNQPYQILNEVAKLQLLAISDRLWTEATGQRTPPGKLGTFWDDRAPQVETIDIDEIL